MNKPNYLLITKIGVSGGSIYEHKIHELLHDEFNITLRELDPKNPKILIYSKLRFIYQNFFLSSKKHDILICNAAGLFGGIHRKSFDKKILILHHLDPNEFLHPNRQVLKINYIKQQLNSFDVVVCVADYWKNYLSEFIDKNKIKVIQNSFDCDFIASSIKSFDKAKFMVKNEIPTGKILVYAGNSITNKGIFEVINKLPDSKYHIMTSGRKTIDAGNHHLELSYTDYLKLLHISDVTILLSKFNEGWNRIAHESLLCGTPVIGTDAGGLGELLKNSGQQIYNQGSDLQKLIKYVVNDEDRREKGLSYAAKFNNEYFKSAWHNLLTSVQDL